MTVSRRQVELIERARVRSLELATVSAVERLRAARAAAAVRWRTFDGGVTLHRSEPFLAERLGEVPGWWVDPEVDSRYVIRCGFDGDGRVVIAKGALHGGVEEQFFSYPADHDELVMMRWNDDVEYRPYVTLIARDDRGRVVETANDRGFCTAYSYDADAVAPRGLTETSPAANVRHVAFDVAPGGGLLRAVEDTVAEAPQVLWDARSHTPEHEFPDYDVLVRTFAGPVAEAMGRRIAAISARFDDDAIALAGPDSYRLNPPVAVARCDLARRLLRDADGVAEFYWAVHDAAGAHGCRDAEQVDLLDELDAEALRALRQFHQRSDRGPAPPNDADARERAASAAFVEIVGRVNKPGVLRGCLVLGWCEPEALSLHGLGKARSRLPVALQDDELWTLAAATAGVDAVARWRHRLGC
jgi:hypothetical protein